MSYEIALVNPRAIPARKRTLKKRGVKMAKRRRKMSAKQLKYFGKRRGKSRAKRAKRAATTVVVSNPRRSRRRSNPRIFGRRRRRSNPRMGGGAIGQVVGTLMPAGIGAVGVLAVDRVLGAINIATKISKDVATQKHINRAARLVAVAGVGIAARKFLGGEQGSKIAVASMGIAVHGLLASFLGSGAAGLSGEMDGMGEYIGADWEPTPGSVISGDDDGYIDGELDGDTDVAPLISGEMDGDDPIGAYDDLGTYDPIGAYLEGDND